jgi:Zn-finger nucleic acid-binding protein
MLTSTHVGFALGDAVSDSASHVELQCPEDGVPLGEVATTASGVCAICRGIWLPRGFLLTIAAAMRQEGWRQYIHWAAVSMKKRPCPACRSLMTDYKHRTDKLASCENCGGLWIPGGVLRRNHSQAVRSGWLEHFEQLTPHGEGEPRSLALLRGPAGAAGVHAIVVDELVTGSSQVWS